MDISSCSCLKSNDVAVQGRGRNLSKIILIFITCNLFVEEVEEINAVSQALYLLSSVSVCFAEMQGV